MLTSQYFAIDKEKLIIDQKELKRRLSVSGDFDVSVFESAVEKVIAESIPKACFVKVPVLADEKGVRFPFGRVESRDIAKNLCGCSEAFVFAITVGHFFFGWTSLQCLTCSLLGMAAELIVQLIFSPIGYRIYLKTFKFLHNLN